MKVQKIWKGKERERKTKNGTNGETQRRVNGWEERGTKREGGKVLKINGVGGRAARMKERDRECRKKRRNEDWSRKREWRIIDEVKKETKITCIRVLQFMWKQLTEKEKGWQDRMGRDGREKEKEGGFSEGWEELDEGEYRKRYREGERDMSLILKDGGGERRNQDLGKGSKYIIK